jgi:hypothetical protein
LLNINSPIQLPFPKIADLFKDRINSQFFMEAVILMCWAIWMSRNDLIFNFKGIQPSLDGAKAIFSSELLLLKHRVKRGISAQFSQWTNSIL